MKIEGLERIADEISNVIEDLESDVTKFEEAIDEHLKSLTSAYQSVTSRVAAAQATVHEQAGEVAMILEVAKLDIDRSIDPKAFKQLNIQLARVVAAVAEIEPVKLSEDLTTETNE